MVIVTKQIKVKRTAYTKLPQDALAKYGRKIVSKTFENLTYEKMATEIADLKDKSEAYDAALLAAADGGKILVAAKDQSKSELVYSLDVLANLAEVYCEGNEQYIINMGFEIKEKPKRSRLPLIEPIAPTNIVLESTGKRGEMSVRFFLENKEHVVNVAVEYRIANSGDPFQNGIYMSTDNMVLTGLPNLKMVEFRFKALGRELLSSDWTDSYFAPVL